MRRRARNPRRTIRAEPAGNADAHKAQNPRKTQTRGTRGGSSSSRSSSSSRRHRRRRRSSSSSSSSRSSSSSSKNIVDV